MVYLDRFGSNWVNVGFGLRSLRLWDIVSANGVKVVKKIPPTRCELKELLKDCSLSLGEAAELMGVPERDVSDHLLGVKPLRIEAWEALTKALGV